MKNNTIMGIILKDYGINAIAYDYDNIVKLLDLYSSLGNCLILGGDVIEEKNEKYEYTYDNRYCDDVEDTVQYTKEKIDYYHNINPKYLYVLTIKSG